LHFFKTCNFFLTAHSSRIFRGKGRRTLITGLDDKSFIFWAATFESEYDEDNKEKDKCRNCASSLGEGSIRT